MPVQRSDTLAAAPVSDSLLSAIELQTPVPLQEVAEPNNTCAAPQPIQFVDDDETGLSDNESVAPHEDDQRGSSVAITDEQSLSTSSPSTSPASPVEVADTLPTTSPEEEVPESTVVIRRHDPYSFIAVAFEDERDGNWTEEEEEIADDYQQGSLFPAPGAFVSDARDELIAEDDWDAPKPAAPKAPVLLPIDADVDEEPAARSAFPEDDWDAPVSRPQPVQRRRNQRGANQSASPSIMCCYFKQTGRCKMGADCWYSHEGNETTPCHYGAVCKAGHAHLSKTGARAAPNRSHPKVVAASHLDDDIEPSGRPMNLRRVPRSDSHTNSRARSQNNTNNNLSTAQRRVAPGPQHLSAALKPSSLPCAFCGGSECVMIQEFPVYEGNQRTVGQRAHCRQCLRTYAL